MKRVGRSLVSAITQTPASAPFGLVTTPPRSLSPTLTPAGADGCAFTGAGGAPTSAASAIAATLRYRLARIVMAAPPVRPVSLRPVFQKFGRFANIHAQTPPLRNDVWAVARGV